MCKISAQYVEACKREKCGKQHFLYSKFKKRHNSFKNWRKSDETRTLICDTRKQSHMQNFNSICLKHVREKCGNLPISFILSWKRGITPSKMTQSDDTQTRSVVHQNKVILQNFSSNTVWSKQVREKCGKLRISYILSSKKRHNSFKNWCKVTALKLDLK